MQKVYIELIGDLISKDIGIRIIETPLLDGYIE